MEDMMAHKVQSRPAPPAAKKPVEPTGTMTMLMLSGAVLKGVQLPAGAEVAIVSQKPSTVKKIRDRFKGNLRTVWKINAAAISATSSKRETAINRAAYAPDARSLAILEGVRIAQEDLREAGGAYDLDQVRTLMHGVSRQAIDKRVQEGRLLAVPGPSNRRSYPTLQFNSDGTVVDGLKAVSEALPTRNPWTILNFLAQPDDRLSGRKPIDVLKEGKINLVVEAAQRIGQQGA
ncbi:MAG TPA: hypothetical protein VMT08_21950 [Bradyrhizobium sp.]|nr:hypothetical protein [Bradyrhizobium sp.]